MLNVLYHNKPIAIINKCFQVSDNNFILFNQAEMKQIMSFKLNLLELMKDKNVPDAEIYLEKYKCWVTSVSANIINKNIERLPEGNNKDSYKSIKLTYNEACLNSSKPLSSNELFNQINCFIEQNIKKIHSINLPLGTKGVWKSLIPIEGVYRYIPVFEDYSLLSNFINYQFKTSDKNLEIKGKYRAIKNFLSENNINLEQQDKIILNKNLDGFLNNIGNIEVSDNIEKPLVFNLANLAKLKTT